MRLSENIEKGYTPSDIKSVFGYDAHYDASGTTVAVITAFDNSSAIDDTLNFCRTFSLPKPEITPFYPSGTAFPSTDRWLTETCLDLQWISVFAPNSRIFVIFAENPFIDTLLSAVNFARGLGAQIITMCFGTEEGAGLEQNNSIFENKGCIFVSSSGDNGGVVSFPSASPDVLSVGGTDINGNYGRRILLSAYENSGGGASDLFFIPQYQQKFYPISKLSDNKRATPDVCFYAGTNPGVAVCKNGKWTTAGGTSLACACVSGICACIVKNNPDILQSGIGKFFYESAGETVYDSPQYMFYDVLYGKSGKFFSSKGWDFCTGLGVPLQRFVNTKKEP